MDKKVILSVCVGSNCSANGNTVLTSKLKKYLKETGLNKQVKLKFQPCSDCCEDGPVVVLNKKPLYQKSFEELKMLVAELIGGGC